MPCWIITFFLGVCTLLFCRTLPSLYWLLCLVPSIFIWWISKERSKKLSWHILIFLLGLLWCLIYVHWITAWRLPYNLEGKNLLITGYIVSQPINKPHRVSFEFKTEYWGQTPGGLTPQKTKLKLSWYGNFPDLKVGDKWQFFVRLKRPHGTLNPGGFDVEKYLLVHHVRARGYVVKSKLNQILSSKLYDYPFARLRQFLIYKLERSLRSDSLAPIITAFITGFESKITKSQWQVLRDSGTSYLVAISGLHIGLVATIIFILFGFLWKRFYRLPLILPARDAGIIAGLFASLLYGLISGFSIPAQRALVMLLVFGLMTLLRRYAKPWNPLLWSLFFVLLINPLSVLTIGFWLSFSAVFAIIYINANRLKNKNSYLSKLWRIQLTVTLILLPFTLLFFQQFSLVTLLANMVTMPVVCLLVIPLSLFGTLVLLIYESFGGWILWCGIKMLHLIWWWLEFLTTSFNGNWYHPIYNWWILITTSVGALILLAPRGFPSRFMGLVWFSPLFFYTPSKPDINGDFWFTLLDVGQGLACVVQTKNHTLLYDTGPKFFNSNAGDNIIIPYLRLAGIKSIDAIILSHGDSDHSGGLRSIVNSYQVGNFLTSVPKLFPPYAQACYRGQNWQWDGVKFHILSPPPNSSLVGNNASCVLKISNRKNSVLLPGDIENVTESLLVENYGLNLKSDLLIAPHHGSSTSSTSDFIRVVQPRSVVFPVGYRNRFRFPHKKVVTRYLKKNSVLLDTSKSGAITFKFSDKSDILSPSCYREVAKHFWHDI